MKKRDTFRQAYESKIRLSVCFIKSLLAGLFSSEKPALYFKEFFLITELTIV